MQYAI
ncbi:hypothetical protein ECEC1869_3591, partial [Escherichia coli EC1869]